jgi:hypothetical protein
MAGGSLPKLDGRRSRNRIIDLHACANQSITTMHGTAIKLAFKILNSDWTGRPPHKDGDFVCENFGAGRLLPPSSDRCKAGHPPNSSARRAWGLRVAKRSSMSCAIVAVARSPVYEPDEEHATALCRTHGNAWIPPREYRSSTRLSRTLLAIGAVREEWFTCGKSQKASR